MHLAWVLHRGSELLGWVHRALVRRRGLAQAAQVSGAAGWVLTMIARVPRAQALDLIAAAQ